MNGIRSRLRFLTAALAGFALLLLSGTSLADPPTRVARLSFMSGPVSFSPAGEEEWVLASPNRPLITGDRLWADAGGRAELQAGTVAIRLGETTNVNVLNLDDRTTQIELTQGSLYVRLWRLDRGDTVEIDTPNLAFTISGVGRYRVDVDPDGNVTTLAVLAGEGEAYGEGAAYRIGAGERYAFSGTGLRDYEYSDIGPPDEFDRWAADRDRRYESSVSARYVSRDVIGYQDLDQYGTWSVVASYGNVWYPRSTPSGWAPYRTGHWSWIDPWGWTWIDEAPWGFAPYHYGRWAYLSGRWGWIPGPINVRPIYAPALVAFIGGGDLRLTLSVGGVASGVAWFPLGPGEVYQPAYRVSRDYFTNVNISNTRITNVNITNVYNNYTNNTAMTNVTYRNREAPGAVTAVPATAFVQSLPVARAAVQLPREVVAQQLVSPVARVAPTRASVVAAAAATSAASAAKPPARALQRDVVARTKPPAPPAAFAARQAGLAANPGRPLEPAAGARPQPATAGAAPPRNVKVVAPTQAAAPAPKGEGRRARGLAGEPGQGAPAGPVGGPARQQAGPSNQRAAPATGEAPKGGAPAGSPSRDLESERRAREAGQRPADLNKGAAAAPPTGAGQTAPVSRPPRERRGAPEGGQGQPSAAPPAPPAAPEAQRPTQEPARQAPPRGPEAQPAPLPQAAPEAQQRRQQRREAPPRPPEAQPAALPPQAAPEAQQRRPEPRREAPPRPPEAPRAAPAAPPPQAVPQPPERRQEQRRGAQPRPPDAPRAAPPAPPGQPPAAQPPRPEPPREAPKGEPKRGEGKGKGKGGDKGNDKDQKDKDKKGSEG